MFKIKKAISLMVVIAVVVSMMGMTGCAEKVTSSTDQTTTSTSNSTVQDKASTEKVDLRFALSFAAADPQNKAAEVLLEQFKKENPNVTIQNESTSSSRYHDKLKTEIASDMLPDVFANWGGSEVRGAVSAGSFLDLTTLLNENPTFKNDFLPGALSGPDVTYEDLPGQWGMPFMSIVTGFFYNKAIFEQVGVTPPETIEDLIVVAQKLKDSGTIPWVVGGKDGWRIEHIYSALMYKYNGAGIAKDLASRKVKYSDPQSVEVFKVIENLRDLGVFGPNPASVDFAMEQNLFQNGKTGMDFLMNAYIENYMGAASPIAKDVGYFAFPYFKDKPQYKDEIMGGGSMCLSISANVKGTNREQYANKLIMKFSGKAGLSEFVKINALIPPVKLDNMEELTTNEVQKQFTATFEKATGNCLDITLYDQVSSMLTKTRSVCTGLLNKQLTAEQAGQELDNEIETNKK